jgi:dTMP kinase
MEADHVKQIDANGCLIVLEGIDGAGKTTQAGLLAERLASRGRNVRTFRCPDPETEIGRLARERVRRDGILPSYSLFALFSADRLDKAPQIRSLLARGHVVVFDRYSPSELAYGGAAGLPERWLEAVEEPMPRPDLVVLLDIDAEIAGERLLARSGHLDSFESDPKMQCDARAIYRRLAATQSGGTAWRALDANRTVEAVSQDVWAAVVPTLGDGVRPD